MGFFRRERVEGKSPEQLRSMRAAGLVVGRTLALLEERVRPGMTTRQLDTIADEFIRGSGAVPSFLGYHGFTGTICASVNEEIVHGIPGERVLAEGDLLSIDCGAIVDGWHGDSAMTLVLGASGALDIDDAGRSGQDLAEGVAGPGDVLAADVALARATRTAMWAGIAALASDGGRLGAVGAAVETAVELAGDAEGVEYGIVEEYVGHGIGSAMHQPPDVVNFRTSDRGPRLRPGMCLAVEPMVTTGSGATRVLEDDWTVVTSDGSRAAHWEHSVAITEAGISVLTAVDGGREGLAPFGVTPVVLDD